MSGLFRKLSKAFALVADGRFRFGLFKGVAATIEHMPVLQPYQFKTIIDVGANRGQFALLMAGLSPDADIIAFEPLIEPYEKLFEMAVGLPKVRAVNAAIGIERASVSMNVSKRDDSSSLLPISDAQTRIFPGTAHDRNEEVQVAPLSDFVDPQKILRPSLLKIDVQGYELNVLKGSHHHLREIDVVYVEASFIELYEGQPLAGDVIDVLSRHCFRLAGVYNLSRDADGRSVQADFLFERRPHPHPKRTSPPPQPTTKAKLRTR